MYLYSSYEVFQVVHGYIFLFDGGMCTVYEYGSRRMYTEYIGMRMVLWGLNDCNVIRAREIIQNVVGKYNQLFIKYAHPHIIQRLVANGYDWWNDIALYPRA